LAARKPGANRLSLDIGVPPRRITESGLALSELEGEIFLMREPGSGTRGLMGQLFESAGSSKNRHGDEQETRNPHERRDMRDRAPDVASGRAFARPPAHPGYGRGLFSYAIALNVTAPFRPQT
jgi:hypothetical protein